jgi:hypothetical protein
MKFGPMSLGPSLSSGLLASRVGTRGLLHLGRTHARAGQRSGFGREKPPRLAEQNDRCVCRSRPTIGRHARGRHAPIPGIRLEIGVTPRQGGAVSGLLDLNAPQ